jgi:hypothetical protein
MGQDINYLDFKKAYAQFTQKRSIVLQNILTEFSIHNMKLVRLLKMCLNDTYNTN